MMITTKFITTKEVVEKNSERRIRQLIQDGRIEGAEKIAEEMYERHEYIAKILRYERPDAIVPGIGGQTGLNLAMQLEKKGVLAPRLSLGTIWEQGSSSLFF